MSLTIACGDSAKNGKYAMTPNAFADLVPILKEKIRLRGDGSSEAWG